MKVVVVIVAAGVATEASVIYVFEIGDGGERSFTATNTADQGGDLVVPRQDMRVYPPDHPHLFIKHTTVING
ncbi:hypothetical protein Syun_024492 [Stephania yunnanensis]|uniref:Uncharacterized protein n=1 Tax=Stephania yunnanensis TaxID=152371 RepID=A0AAP0I4H4_9MAGN